MQGFAIAYPLLIQIAVYGAWLPTVIALGRIPRPMWDGVNSPTYDWPVIAAFFWIMVGGPMWLLVTIALLVIGQIKLEQRRSLVVTVICAWLLMLVSLAMFQADPLEALEWLLD